MTAPLTALPEINAFEVTVCRQGKNNKKRFPIWKAQEDRMDNFNVILKSVLETELDEEANLDELFKGAELSEKAMNAIKSATRILMAFKDEMPEDVMTKLAKLAGYKGPEKTEKGCDMDEEMKKQLDDLTAENAKLKADIEKAKGDTDDGDDTQLDDLRKAYDERLETLQKSNEELAKSLEAEKDARNLAGWKERVEKEASHYPGKSADEMAAILQRVEKVDADLAKAQFEDMVKASEALKASDLLKSAGAVGVPAGGSAWDKIEKMADGLLEKSTDAEFTKAKAISLVLERNPELYTEYEAEQRG